MSEKLLNTAVYSRIESTGFVTERTAVKLDTRNLWMNTAISSSVVSWPSSRVCKNSETSLH